MTTVNIKNADKAEVLAALFNRARPLGMGMLHYKERDMPIEEAREILAQDRPPYFDYAEGRVMKVDLDKDDMRTDLYNRDNGDGAAEEALAKVPGVVL